MIRPLLILSVVLALPALAGPSAKDKALVEALSGRKAPTIPPKFVWKVPGEIQGIEVPGVIESHGVPMKLHAVHSKWQVQELAAYFAREFDRAGLYVPPPKDQIQVLREPSITALDPFREISLTVIFQENPDKTTTVIIGEAHLADRKKPSDGAFAPLVPGASNPVVSNLEGMRTLSYRTQLPEAEVRAFYQKQLTTDGYQQPTPGVFVKNGQQLQLEYDRTPETGQVLLIERAYVPRLQDLPR